MVSSVYFILNKIKYNNNYFFILLSNIILYPEVKTITSQIDKKPNIYYEYLLNLSGYVCKEIIKLSNS